MALSLALTLILLWTKVYFNEGARLVQRFAEPTVGFWLAYSIAIVVLLGIAALFLTLKIKPVAPLAFSGLKGATPALFFCVLIGLCIIGVMLAPADPFAPQLSGIATNPPETTAISGLAPNQQATAATHDIQSSAGALAFYSVDLVAHEVVTQWARAHSYPVERCETAAGTPVVCTYDLVRLVAGQFDIPVPSSWKHRYAFLETACPAPGRDFLGDMRWGRAPLSVVRELPTTCWADGRAPLIRVFGDDGDAPSGPTTDELMNVSFPAPGPEDVVPGCFVFREASAANVSWSCYSAHASGGAWPPAADTFFPAGWGYGPREFQETAYASDLGFVAYRVDLAQNASHPLHLRVHGGLDGGPSARHDVCAFLLTKEGSYEWLGHLEGRCLFGPEADEFIVNHALDAYAEIVLTLEPFEAHRSSAPRPTGPVLFSAALSAAAARESAW